MKSESDYVTDYGIGILTVKNESIIKETSALDVSYDYSMFGTQAKSTLIVAGGRLNLTDNVSLSTRILYNFMAGKAVLLI
ncbi:MAG: hypothetical protein LBN19_00105 [Endomicrobium sp.]|nr:hypothetical protein [Endomicrobium sp.]